MSSWHSYPSIFNLGHRAIKDLLSVEVNVEEKVDGSQFSFGLVEASDVDLTVVADPVLGPLALKVRSKGAVMHIDAPEKMFTLGANLAKRLYAEGLLHPGWTYRGEFLAKPKHNSLAYDRAPNHNFILFDVSTDDGGFLTYEDKKAEGDRLGLEVVPRLFSGIVASIESFRAFLDTVSVLGGQKIEGVVIKPVNYDLYGVDKKVLMGKFVSEVFKEVHSKAWGEANPSGTDIIAQISKRLNTTARWNKAIQHLREAGKLTDSPQDIGPLIKEIPIDIEKECVDEIKDYIFSWAWPHIRRQVTKGFPEYYKELLLKQAFEHEPGKHLVNDGATDASHPTDPDPLVGTD